MALNLPVAELIEQVGHDGSEIIFENQTEPGCRAGHSLYELIYQSLKLGYAVTPMPLILAHASIDHQQYREVWDLEDGWDTFHLFGVMRRGVVECHGPRWKHMVAFDQGTVFDPDGDTFPFLREEFEKRQLYPVFLWRVDKIA